MMRQVNKCIIEECDEDAVSQLLFVGLPLPIKEDRFCLKHGKEYQKGEKFLVYFVR